MRPSGKAKYFSQGALTAIRKISASGKSGGKNGRLHAANYTFRRLANQVASVLSGTSPGGSPVFSRPRLFRPASNEECQKMIIVAWNEVLDATDLMVDAAGVDLLMSD